MGMSLYLQAVFSLERMDFILRWRVHHMISLVCWFHPIYFHEINHKRLFGVIVTISSI